MPVCAKKEAVVSDSFFSQQAKYEMV